MELKDMIGRTIIDIYDAADGLNIELDNGKKLLITQTHFPDGSFNDTIIEERR